jgi:hypothetical protein
MKYRDIMETAPGAQTNSQRTQRDKLTAANDKVAKASQTYQNTVKAAHDSATAAKRKLAAPPKPPAPSKPVIATPLKLLRPLLQLGLG